MTWEDLHNELADIADSFLDHEMPQLKERDGSFGEDYQVFIRAQITPEQGVLDAVEAIIEGLPLPEMTPHQRLHVYIRLLYASEFAYAMHHAPAVFVVPDPPANRRLRLTWLLCHVWNYPGFRMVNAVIPAVLNTSVPYAYMQREQEKLKLQQEELKRQQDPPPAG